MKTLDQFYEDVQEEGLKDFLLKRKQNKAINSASERRDAARHFEQERERAERFTQKLRYKPSPSGKGLKDRLFDAAYKHSRDMQDLADENWREGDRKIDKAWKIRAKRRQS